jgi:23S rRNA (cytidine1920-2'-O)/16S rRNA (cytidine1409-2'-O)-methyltransferase
MAQSNVLKKYLDAGMQFTSMTQTKAEALVKELVKAGELQTEQAQATVTELIERSRKNTEAFIEQVRREVAASADSLGLATIGDIARLEKLIAAIRPDAAPAAKTAPAKKAPAKKAAAKKAPAKKAPAKKAAAKKAAAKKAAAKKAAAKKARRRRPRPRRPRSPRRAEAATAPRRRLDAELVRRGLASSREKARELIARGEVKVAGAPADKASRQVGAHEPIVVLGPPPRFVSRGGEKLAAALERFGLDLEGRRVLDAGASTGGFTDCALQAGAAHVVAVDVGRGQLHQRLRTHPLVDSRERTNVRHLVPGDLGALAEVVVADLSFISLRTVAPALVALAEPGADLVLLVKPQFEAGREEVSRGRGIITDPDVWARTLHEVAAALEGLGAAIMDLMPSPLRGADGNVEFLLLAQTDASPSADREALVRAAVAEVAG